MTAKRSTAVALAVLTVLSGLVAGVTGTGTVSAAPTASRRVRSSTSQSSID